METVIRKWGNSPAVRLHAAAMRTAAFDLEQPVTVRALKGRIIIEAAQSKEFKLDDLVAGITPANRHASADFGGPVGRESL